LGRVRKVVFVRLVDHPLDAAPVESESQVDERLRGGGDRNVVAGGEIARLKRQAAVDTKSGNFAMGLAG
jgi:hypothetical protein